MFKLKTAYEMRISDWSSDVCSSDHRFEGERQLVFEELVPDEVREHGGKIGVHRDRLEIQAVAAKAYVGRLLIEPGRPDQPMLPHATEDLITLNSIGRESCGDSVCQSVVISGESGALKQKKTK